MGKLKKIVVLPIEPGLSFSELPAWLQRSWSPNLGETPAGVARYLTALLLEPARGLSTAAPKVVGRGGALDRTERNVENFLQTHRRSPNVSADARRGGKEGVSTVRISLAAFG